MKFNPKVWWISVCGVVVITSMIFWSNSDYEFRPNVLPWKINEDYKYIVKDYDISIVYEMNCFGPWSGYKILAKNEDKWVKLTVKGTLGDFKIKPLRIVKDVGNNLEPGLFLDSLVKYNLFNLPSEKDLLSPCNKTSSEVADGCNFSLTIISGLKVRELNYDNPQQWHDKCPSEEWGNIQKIITLFSEQW